MKLALITDPKGFSMIDFRLGMGYHLALAQYVLIDKIYAEFYASRSRRGHFIMMDNGAAEGINTGTVNLLDAAELIRPDEIILPDVMGDLNATLEATTDKWLLGRIPPRMRAVVPQGSNEEEWLACANFFAENLEFATMCVPKHIEKWPGGRVAVLGHIFKLGWHKTYNIHLLGVHGSPYMEIATLKAIAPWARGIDTAAPFALAQAGRRLDKQSPHVSHMWGRNFDELLAYQNAIQLLSWVTE